MNREERAAVLDAFKALRKENKSVAARANYKCCMGCATAAAPNDRLFFYWHAQDDEHAFERENRFGRMKNENRSLCIRYCATPEALEPQLGPAAHRLVALLKDRNLRVDWDGDTGTVIRVLGFRAPSSAPNLRWGQRHNRIGANA